MRIAMTEMLKARTGMLPGKEPEPSALFSFTAHLFSWAHREGVLLLHDATGMAFVLHGLDPGDFDAFPSCLEEALRSGMRGEGIRGEIVQAYLKEAGPVVFTAGEEETAPTWMEERLGFALPWVEEARLFQQGVSRRINRQGPGTQEGDVAEPWGVTAFIGALEEHFGRGVRQTEAVELLVRLLPLQHSVWRRIIVPSDFRFLELHEVLAIAFGWPDRGRHEFRVEDPRGALVEAIGMDGAPDEAGSGVHLVRREGGARLLEYADPFFHVRYFHGGENPWVHEIRAIRWIADHATRTPLLTMAEGVSPKGQEPLDIEGINAKFQRGFGGSAPVRPNPF